MESIKSRLKRLEKRSKQQLAYPYVVLVGEGEPTEEAAARALCGLPEPQNWCFVIAPQTLPEQRWEELYTPPTNT